jgi:ABC-type branched-subunit amino acid transport system permease subunit
MHARLLPPIRIRGQHVEPGLGTPRGSLTHPIVHVEHFRHGALFGLGAYTSAILSRDYGFSFPAAFVCADALTAGGLNALSFRVGVFILSALIAGLTGNLYAHYQGYISPDSLGFWTGANALIMNVLVGVGAVLLILLPELLRDLQQYQRLIYDLTLIVLLLFMPQGLAGLVRAYTARLRAKEATR